MLIFKNPHASPKFGFFNIHLTLNRVNKPPNLHLPPLMEKVLPYESPIELLPLYGTQPNWPIIFPFSLAQFWNLPKLVLRQLHLLFSSHLHGIQHLVHTIKKKCMDPLPP